MGKRKTRKRSSRRSKKGGYHAKAGTEICIWTNKGARRCGIGVEENEDFAQKIYPIGLNPGGLFSGLPKHDTAVDYPLSKLTHYVPNMGLEIVSNKNIEGLMDKEIPLYIVLHERKSSKIGGPRYGLYKHPNCEISIGQGEYAYTLHNPLWNDKLHFNIGPKNVVSGMWGSKVANLVGTLMTEKEANYNTDDTEDYDGYNGGKRRSRRRRSTKKRRKSRRRRKRTKKRRRRRS